MSSFLISVVAVGALPTKIVLIWFPKILLAKLLSSPTSTLTS